MPKSFIICVDDDLQVLSSLKQQLAAGLGSDYTYELAESGEEGLEIIRDLLKEGNSIPVVISDQLMPGMKGDQFLVHVQQLDTRIRKILLTGQASAGAVGNALNHADLYRYIAKPWDETDLIQTVKEAAKSFEQDEALDRKVALLTQINEYARLLAQHLQLDTFADALLRRIVQDTGSSRACLALRNGTPQPNWLMEANVGANNRISLKPLTMENVGNSLPVGVLTEALANQETVVLHNALTDATWKQDTYVQAGKVRSLLCAPIMKQDRVLGALYLEQASTANKYKGESAELVSAVLGQAALALDHVLLYQDLEAKVQARTADIQEDHGNLKESIYYASRIQQSMLPSLDNLQLYFPQSFLWYHPRDIVSGDFYWLDQMDGITYMAVGDCTGHGVPGAFLTMLGVNLLNQVVKERRIKQPDEILLALHQNLQRLLRNDSERAVEDGMDIALCSYDANLGILKYASARRPLYLHDGTKLTKLPAGRTGIGGGDDLSEEDFEGNSLSISAGHRLYLLTDGITDQFSEDNKKKFGSKRLEELLTQTMGSKIAQQGSAIENRIKVWQGTNRQTDDLLMMGVQF